MLTTGDKWLIGLGVFIFGGSALVFVLFGPLLVVCLRCCPGVFNRLTAPGRSPSRLLTRESIECKLPSEKLTVESFAALPFEAKSCSICIDDYQLGDVTRELDCRHVFHADCVDTWFLEHRLDPTCPLCTAPVTCLQPVGSAGTGVSWRGEEVDAIEMVPTEERPEPAEGEASGEAPTEQARNHNPLRELEAAAGTWEMEAELEQLDGAVSVATSTAVIVGSGSQQVSSTSSAERIQSSGRLRESMV